MRIGFAVLAVSMVPLPAAAAITAVAPAPSDSASAIARSIFPEDRLLELVRLAFDAGVERELVRHPDEHAFYAARPALRAEVWEPMRAAVVEEVRRTLPGFRNDLAALLDQLMAPADREAFARFLATPMGGKMIRIVYSSVGEDPTEDAETSRRRTRKRLMESITPEDRPALEALSASGAAEKLTAITPRTNALVAAWVEGIKRREVPRLNAGFRSKLAEIRRALEKLQ